MNSIVQSFKQLSGIPKDLWDVASIEKVTIITIKDIFTDTFTWFGYISFKKESYSGEKSFEAATLPEVLNQMSAFLESLNKS